MLRIGLIGAGHISITYLEAYKNINNCKVVAICDVNQETASERADKYGIEKVYTDYRELLKDDSIDAVNILTPTFTHKGIILEALKCGKHVMCEKPPALNAEEVRECEQAAKGTGKLLWFAFVCRYRNAEKYVKSFIESGKLGKLVSAECRILNRCMSSESWFASREKGGGVLRDQCIHSLDSILYFMNYPKPVAVIAAESFVNSDLPEKMSAKAWKSYDKSVCKRDVESAIEGFVTFEDGTSVHIKTSSVLNAVEETKCVEITGEKAGIQMFPYNGPIVKMMELVDNAFKDSEPEIESNDCFYDLIKDFVDSVMNGTEGDETPAQAVILMQIIDAMYESAKTRKPVVFE